MVTESNRKIKIAHIITRMDRGGAPDIVRLLIEKLDSERFDVILIYGTTVCPSQKSKELIDKLKESAILVPSLCRAIDPIRDFKAFLRIRSILKKGKFDIVHTHTAKAGVLGRIAAKIAGVRRVVHSPHGHDFYGYFGKIGSFLVVLAEKFSAFFCDKIHVLTELEKNDMIVFKICPVSKLEVIYSGVEIGLLRPSQDTLDKIKAQRPVSERVYAVGIVGRLEPIKGVEYFIDAAKIIAEKIRNVRFLIIGDGSLRNALEQKVRGFGLAECFIFMGWVEDVNAIFFSLDVLVLSSLNEAVGRSVLEAQAAGVPVVATRVGGVPEVIVDRVTGLLVDAKDPQGLAEAVMSLLQDDVRRGEMSRAAQGWVDEKFSDRVMVRKFEELYQGLLS